MKRTRHTPEQVIRKLRDAERMLAEGKEFPEVCRALEISPQTFHRWQKQFQGMRREEIVELKNLRKENTRLKRLVANQALDIDMLKDVARGNW
jgi:transposase-like protein